MPFSVSHPNTVENRSIVQRTRVHSFRTLSLLETYIIKPTARWSDPCTLLCDGNTAALHFGMFDLRRSDL